MSKHIKILSMVGLVALAAACAPKEEVIVVEPISTEPVFTGKYK